MKKELTEEAESLLSLQEERDVEDFCHIEDIPILTDAESYPMVWQTEVGLGDLKVVISVHPSEGKHIQPVLDGYMYDFFVFTTGEYQSQVRMYGNQSRGLRHLSSYDPEITWAIKLWLVIEGYENPVKRLNVYRDPIDITSLEIPYPFWTEVQAEVLRMWGIIEDNDNG